MKLSSILELPQKELILLTVSAVASLSIFPLFILSYLAKDFIQMVADLCAISTFIAIFIGVYRTKNTDFYGNILACLILPIILTLIYFKGAGVLYWLYPIIVVAFYLLTPLRAVIYNTFLMFIACLLLYPTLDHFNFFRIIVTLILTNLVSFLFSVFMQRQHKKLKQNEKTINLRNEILEKIVSSSEMKDVLPAIVTCIENEYPRTMCSILLLDSSKKHLVLGAAPSLPDFYNEAVDGIEIGQGVGSCGTSAFTAKRVIVEDLKTHPYWAPWVELTGKAQLGACWSEPILSLQGQVLGTFAIYHKQKATAYQA